MTNVKRLCLLTWLALATVGCESKQASIDANRPNAENANYRLESEPADPHTPTSIKASITEPTLIAVAGRIDAGDIEPFQDGMASFMISQLPDESHAEGDADHADNCPFCKRKLKNAPKAMVRILDDAGNVLPVDARKLLGIAKGDVVVVQGLATYLEAVNTIQIDADGVFVR